MARTTTEAVEGIIETDGSVFTDLTPFIESANELVTELCTASDYSDARLELIERWLAAHFFAVSDYRLEVSSVDAIREQFQSRIDLGLDVTHYGQQAMRLDTAGNLAAMNNAQKNVQSVLPTARRSVGITWLGTKDQYE